MPFLKASSITHSTRNLFYSTAFTCNANCSKWGRQERTNCRCILACWGLDNSDWSSDGSLIHNHRPAVRNINTLKKMSWEHQSWKVIFFKCGLNNFTNVTGLCVQLTQSQITAANLICYKYLNVHSQNLFSHVCMFC
jgi:hypothetical protein